MPFEALGLDPKIAKAVREAGYTEPTPIQTKAIPLVLRGSDVIGIAQTGTGKTAAFVLPILQRLSTRGSATNRRCMRAIVIAPTRELVVQIEENVRKYARHLHLRIATVYGGVGERPQIQALRAGTEIVIATPGRLIDLMDQGHVDFSGLEVAVLDEADRMLDMGFLPAMRRIVKALPKQRQTMMFSATLSKEIETLTNEFLVERRNRPDRPPRQSRRTGHAVRLRNDQGSEAAAAAASSARRERSTPSSSSRARNMARTRSRASWRRPASTPPRCIRTAARASASPR